MDRLRRREFLAGCRDVSPSLLGLLPFGLVAGIAAVAAGMTPLEGMALSVLSFSGIAQLIVCQLLAADSPIVVMVAAAAVVSLRLVMYSAALAPHLAHLDRHWRALIAFVMTDQSFAMTIARFGVLAGARVPASWSLDFAVVLTFIALLVPVVRTRADLAAALVAGSIALAAAGMPYRLSLVIASIAGIGAGLALERLRAR